VYMPSYTPLGTPTMLPYTPLPAS